MKKEKKIRKEKKRKIKIIMKKKTELARLKLGETNSADRPCSPAMFI